MLSLGFLYETHTGLPSLQRSDDDGGWQLAARSVEPLNRRGFEGVLYPLKGVDTP
jgi:hypothetical protein